MIHKQTCRGLVIKEMIKNIGFHPGESFTVILSLHHHHQRPSLHEREIEETKLEHAKSENGLTFSSEMLLFSR